MTLLDVVKNAVNTAYSVTDSLLETITYNSVTSSTYDPVTDSETKTITSVTLKAAIYKFQDRSIIGKTDNQQQNDVEKFIVLINNNDLITNNITPKTSDEIVWNSIAYTIRNVEILPKQLVHKLTIMEAL